MAHGIGFKLKGCVQHHHFETGSRRSADRDTVRYDLISPLALERLARTYHEGAAKHGAMNWERGMPVWDLLNHTIAHLFAYLSGDRAEDHLAHAAWGVFGAMHSETQWRDLNQGTLRGPGCQPPDEVPHHGHPDPDPHAPDRRPHGPGG